MHAVATGRSPSASRASEPAQVFRLLRIAGRLHARVDDALAVVGLSYGEYRVLESLGGAASADEGAVGPATEADPELLAALAGRGLVSRSVGQQGTGDTALTRLGSRSLLAARAHVRSVARDFAAAVGDTEAGGLVCLLERVDGHGSHRRLARS